MNRQQRIEKTLMQNLSPTVLNVIDESHQHHVPDNAQTHFKVIAVSKSFEGLSLIKRHRLINDLLSPERETGMHALSLHLKTPDEWDASSESPRSPACRDGYKNG